MCERSLTTIGGGTRAARRTACGPRSLRELGGVPGRFSLRFRWRLRLAMTVRFHQGGRNGTNASRNSGSGAWSSLSLCRWRWPVFRDRPKSQIRNLTLLTSNRDRLRFGLADGSGHLVAEQVPEVIARQFQPQVLIGAPAAAFPSAKRPCVPIQSLQVQRSLIQRPMPRLVHPQHAVHALHRTAGTHRSSQQRRHLPVRLLQVRLDLLAENLLHQRAAWRYPPTAVGSEFRDRCRRSHHKCTKAARNSSGTEIWLRWP